MGLEFSCRCRNGKRRRRGTTRIINPQSPNESIDSHEQRETRTWRFRTCCLPELVCCLCRRLRRWWTTWNRTIGRNGRRRDDSNRSFPLVFWHMKTQARFKFCFFEIAGIVKLERHVVNGKVPQYTPFHFLWVSSKILAFTDSFWNAIMNRARKHSKTRWFTRVWEWKWFRKTTWGWSLGQQSCWNGGGRSETTVQNSKHKRACLGWQSVAQLAFFILQRKSWTKLGLVQGERRANWRELVEDGQSQWRNWEMELGFVNLEKMVSVLIASRMTRGIFVGHRDRTGAVLFMTKNEVVRGTCWTRQTLSDAWESKNIEVDEESYSS